MKKALLVGNGFTLNLIEAYKNQSMMAAFYKRIPDMVDRIQKDFNVFRNLAFESKDLYIVTEALICGDNVLPRDDLYPSDDEIQITEEAKVWVIERLIELKFPDVELVFESFFKSYGLIYSLNKPNIEGVETYLKVVALYELIGRYSKDEYNNIKLVANEVYHNRGKHGKANIDNKSIDVAKLDVLLNEFGDIFTTNYDTILDDFLEPHNKFPFHLHGGFSIVHRNKDPDGRYGPTEAKLIWGINAEDKFKYLSPGWDFADLNFEAIRFEKSRLADYFDYLQNKECDEIHILGFSGENDYHINRRIIENPHIKNIIWYVDPSDVNKLETQVRSRLLFSGEKKAVHLKTWNDFWDKIKML